MKEVFVVKVKDVETKKVEWVEVHDNQESLEEAVYLIEFEGDYETNVDIVRVNRCEIG